MKLNPVPFLVAATFFGCLLTSASQAQIVTGNDQVRIEVQVKTEQDRQGNKGTTVDTVTQGKTLLITLTGKAKTPETRTGTWQTFGRNMDDNKLVPLESGEITVDLTKGAQKIESKKITTTYTAGRSTGSGKGNKGGAKKAPGEGAKYAGYGITIKDGDKVVGERFDPVGLKGEIAK
jgi:hypothetical protein